MNYNAPESGIAAALASRGRRGDSMLVHMAPEEVKGLQALALAHGGSLTINPQTGLYEASFLKKILPTIIGAIVPSVPGLGSIAKTIGFGNTALGTSLLVGGASALIEGDLKKGLEAGLGAYSGANISESLKAASVAATPAKLSAEQLRELPRAESAARELVGATEVNPLQSSQGISSVPYRPIDLGTRLSNQISSRMPSVDLTPGAAPVFAPTSAAQPSVMGGIKSLFTSPESRTAFGEALGGGFKSPLMQNISRAATYTGLMNALTPEPQQLPTSGAMGEDYVYIPGGYNPLYGRGGDQPFQLPGKYYKRTPKGLVPFDPFALAPGGRAAGGEIKSYADGGIVDPNRDPGGNLLTMPRETQTPFSPYFTNPVADPNVAATRAYIEDLNRRAKNPETFAYPGMGSTGLGGTNEPYVPGPSTGGGGGDGAGGGAGDVAAAIAGQYLVNKGIGAGIGAIKNKITTGEFFPDVDDLTGVTPAGKIPVRSDLTGVEVTGRTVGSPTDADLAAGRAANQAALDVPSAETIDAITKAKLGTSLPASAEGIAALKNAINVTGKAAFPATSTLPKADLAAKYATETAGTGAGGVAGKIIPGIQTALGLYETGKAIEAGKEGRAAFSAAMTAPAAAKLLNIGAIGGPAGILAAAAIAAIGASLVNTKEFGDKALENYWKAVDSGRGIGQTPPDELAQGFINFYRTNKNNFAGQEKYGRTGNEDFVYDMTQVINNAVREGKVGKDVDAATMYEQVVQPWLNSMGPGPQNEDARRIQDFMMTDLINSFMSGKPISHAQVKGDKKFKIVSERPVYAGTPPSDMQMYGQMPAGFQGRPDELRGIGRDEFRTPFSEPQAAAPPPPPTPFSEPEPAPYMPRIIDEEPAPPSPPPQMKVSPPPTPFSEPEPRDYILPTPFIEEEEEPRPRKRVPRSGKAFNYGGAVGEDYNFGFAGGGMPGEYQAGGKLLDGPGDGMSDDIPAVIRGKGVQRAALADGEFVIPADVVSHLGNGSTKAGAKKLYDMMARVRKARTGKTNQAPAVKTNRLLPA